MNTKHLLFTSSLPFTSLPVKALSCKQTCAASQSVSVIEAGANRIFTSMYNMHCCC
ncbi:hypothetical protein [Mucilaginibacter sp. OK098]|uniref:hypothetical protein n=1 Tax=Mucilaginibacter sp. OK098 TaxID=1855297 RepID=UPI0013564BFB|nr:hypothetical protein [Mucilaginibacter sp. OK098]